MDCVNLMMFFATVVCVYAPTFRTPGDRIKCFYEDLQDVFNGIPCEDLLLLLGDLIRN